MLLQARTERDFAEWLTCTVEFHYRFIPNVQDFDRETIDAFPNPWHYLLNGRWLSGKGKKIFFTPRST